MQNRTYVFGLFMALAAILLGTATPASASRPFVLTESAVALPPGGVRVEAGLNHEKWDNAKIYAALLEVSYSLYANLDLEIEQPYVVAGVNGVFSDDLGDLWAKAKINFVKERAANPLSISGQLGIKFPTGGAPGATDETDVRIAALASKAFGEVTVHGNFFYTFVGDDPGPPVLDDVFGVSFGMEFPTPYQQIDGVLELIWEEARTSLSNDRLEMMLGTLWTVAENTRVDASLRGALESDNALVTGQPEIGVALGITHDMGY